MRLRRIRGALAALIAVVALLGAMVSPASAYYSYHAWSYAVGLPQNGGYTTGVSSQHVDVNFTIPGAAGSCQNVVYQTEWALITFGTEWLEEGTGDCPWTDFYYTAYGHDGGQVTFVEFTQNYPGGCCSHTFKILRVNSSQWRFYLDGGLRPSYVTWATGASKAQVGFETWVGGIGISPVSFNSMAFADSLHGSAFTLFAGRQGSWIGGEYDHPGEMCGRWVNDYTWSAAENTSC
jgi:hypothetical protein